MKLNKIQSAAYDLIKSDARFIYTLIRIQQNAKRIKSNYMMMSQPYIGIFADGAEQWCRKMKLNAPMFSAADKKYYDAVRQSHKLLELTYEEYKNKLMGHLKRSDEHFYKIRGPWQKIFGYWNFGADRCNGKFCGNTIICDMNTPLSVFSDPECGPKMKKAAEVAGRLAAFFECTKLPPFDFDKSNKTNYKDYNFSKKCPLKLKNELGFVLFSLLCNINFVIEFIDGIILEEVPQKLKFAYLQYYYLCDFIDDVNLNNGTSLTLNKSLKNPEFRNCLAHYGLGQFFKNDSEVLNNDILKGLTNKAFSKDYADVKEELYMYLKELTAQIEKILF